MGIFGKNEKNNDLAQLSGALKSKEALSEILIESIGDGIIATNTEGRIILMNSSAGKLTEWAVDEAMSIDSRLVIKILGDEKAGTIVPDADHPFSNVLKTKNTYSQTVLLVSRNNQRTYVSLAISPVILPKNNELVGTVAVLRDVNAERSQEQRSADFISTASHEMRTPVAAIEGYLALALNDKVSQIDPRAREYLEKAHSSTQHLGKLFQDLLTSAKAEDGRLTSHPQVVEMNSFLEQLTEDLRFSAEKKGLSVEFVHGTADQSTIIKTGEEGNVGKTITPLYFVHVDPDRIREVISNLFDNAVKYTEEGKIKIGITGDNNVVQLHVSDTGPGIPKEDVPHLFQKFYRVDNSATRSVGGTGLGLYICNAIIQLYNGTIWAESTVGQGSIFYINLPRLSSQQAAHLQAEERAKPQI